MDLGQIGTKMKHKIDFINENYSLVFTSKNLFLDGFLDYLEDKEKIFNNDRKRQKETYKKALQRGSPEAKINAMYEFLIKQKKIKDEQKYKTTFNDDFEKTHLGEECYNKLCNFAKNKN